MKHRELSLDELTLVHGGVSQDVVGAGWIFFGAATGALNPFGGAVTAIFANPSTAGDFPSDTNGYVDGNGVPIGNGGMSIDPGTSIDTGVDASGGEIGGDVGGGDYGGGDFAGGDFGGDFGGDVGGGIDIGGV